MRKSNKTLQYTPLLFFFGAQGGSGGGGEGPMPDKGVVEQAVQWALAIAADDTHGYDQAHRLGPDYDCSSFVSTSYANAGLAINPANTTSTIERAFKAVGFVSVSDPNDRQRGDIFGTADHHVVMCIDHDNIVHASINEKGETTGGQSGDQTGKEICTRSFYVPDYGWGYHLRYPETTETYAWADDAAKTVIAGKLGNGETRKENLYRIVQDAVNKMLRG